jgi:hypothetical protein
MEAVASELRKTARIKARADVLRADTLARGYVSMLNDALDAARAIVPGTPSRRAGNLPN